MQTIYTFSYTPAIATGTNTIGVNWRMAYQQPIMLYKGTANTIKIVVFATNQRVVNLTGYQIQVQIVDKETEEHYITRTATVNSPTAGVGTITFTEAELRNLENRFYHIIARLVLPSDGSSVTTSEILYLDDNYGAFLPIQIENAWNYQPTIISTENGAQVINFRSIGETPDSYTGHAGKLLKVNNAENAIEFSNITTSNTTISSTTDSLTLTFGTQLVSLFDNSTDPIHNEGDGGFITLNDITHLNDAPRFEIWYGNANAISYDPPGQHSLDIRSPDAGSYVEFASHDLNSFIGIKNNQPFIQVDWNNDPTQGWLFNQDGSARLSRQGIFHSYDGTISTALSDGFFNIFSITGLSATSTTFDKTGEVYFGGNLYPGSFSEPLPTPEYSLGSIERPWKDIYLSNSTIYLGNVPISVDNTGNLTVNGNVVAGGGGNGTGPVQPYLELTNDAIVWTPYAGALVTFTKDDYATGAEARDEIDDGLAIARNNNQGIYNPYLEPDWDNTFNDGPSPAGTLWNKDGWDDLTNLDQRIYFSFYDSFLRFGNNVLAAEAIMKDVANDKYYKFDFTTWGNAGQGAPVAYTRTQLDPTTGDPIGEPVTFTKAGNADPAQVNDPIDTNLTIARANNQSIYNIALETGYSSVGDGEDSPEGTLWNDSGWNNFRDVRSRSYDTFERVMNGAIGNNVLDKELVMHDTINDKYYAVKFSAWTQNNEGGGFSYTRRLINTSQYFTKTDYGSEVDILIPDDGSTLGVGITRDNNNGIYNPYREEGWDDNVSPGGTLWNIDGWTDFSDVESRTYTPLYEAFGFGGLGNKIVGTECVMYLPDNGKYYAVKFSAWTQNNQGGGFSYERYELDLTKLNEGIKFADGTILKSANDFNRIKSTASGDRRIEEASGNRTVTVTSTTTTNLSTVASRASSNTNQIWIDATATTIDDVIENPSSYNIIDNQTMQFSLDNSTWYAFPGGINFSGNERGYIIPANVTYDQGDTIYFRYSTGGAPQVWWDKNNLPSGGGNFRGAVIDYHCYTGEATHIGTIHIVDDDGEENVTHTSVSSGDTDSENDDLVFVQNEGTISYRRMDGESKTAKFHWTAKIFYGSEYYD